MFGKLLMDSPLLAFPLAGLVIFATVFLSVIVVVARRKPAAYARAAALPLDREEDRRG
jgi:hypothetical protein